jgi:alanine racemase
LIEVLASYQKAIVNNPDHKMTTYSTQDIASQLSGTLFSGAPENSTIQHILTDSRRIMAPASSLFFAIAGDRHNGHSYIDQLIKDGVRNFVVSENNENYAHLPANFIVVKNSLAALQQLVQQHRNRFKIPVIGITGSNGKTVVKEWIYQLLREEKNIVRSPKSYNSQIGVPLSVWQLEESHELAIFEAGISEPGEMQKIAAIIQPDIGVFTNIGDAHAVNFETKQQKVQEKLKLFAGSKVLIYCKDYTLVQEELIHSETLSKGMELFTWSRRASAMLQVGHVVSEHLETEIQGLYKNEFIKIKIPFTDDASIENAIHCWCVMLVLGYGHEMIAERMKELSPVAMRLELKEGINNCSIINDTYNSDLGSLTIALDFLNQQNQHGKRTLILSDILQSGKNEEQLYQEVARLLAQKQVNRLIGIGNALCRQAHLFSIEKEFYDSTATFLKKYNPGLFKEETILLKGARAFSFEKISAALQQKTHETVLEINLNSLIHNLNYYRSLLHPGTKIMAMVKAFSYGSGSFEIANILQFHRADYLAVAYADEGVELRKAGITLPILVMSPEEYSFESMLHYQLEPEIYSFRTLNLYAEAIKRYQHSTPDALYPIHIKLDTGMHRLGFDPIDINELIIRIKNYKFLKVQSVFSHLAGSEEAEHSTFTELQISKFVAMQKTFIEHFNTPFLSHIVNSAGIKRFPHAHFDMVRLGIGLYGIAPDVEEQKALQTIGTLKTTISQIKDIPAGETIGYSRKGKAHKPLRIATIAIGYADGLNRKLGNGNGMMYVNGKRVYTIGNICMDMCMLDITNIDANEGDEVVVFGSEYSITEMAQALGTIPYEVLTNISQRVKRIYYQE